MPAAAGGACLGSCSMACRASSALMCAATSPAPGPPIARASPAASCSLPATWRLLLLRDWSPLAPAIPAPPAVAVLLPTCSACVPTPLPMPTSRAAASAAGLLSCLWGAGALGRMPPEGEQAAVLGRAGLCGFSPGACCSGGSAWLGMGMVARP